MQIRIQMQTQRRIRIRTEIGPPDDASGTASRSFASGIDTLRSVAMIDVPMSRDTSDAAREAQVAAVRRLTPSERMERAAQMSEDARRIAIEAERRRHPGLTDEEARRAVLRRVWGAALAASHDFAMLPEIPRFEALIDRVLELDEAYDEGTAHTFLITY